jgi:hypothetical protein
VRPRYEDVEFARFERYPQGDERMVCPCGARQAAAFFTCDRAGALVLDPHWCLITCELCGRIITRDGVVIGYREVRQEEGA